LLTSWSPEIHVSRVSFRKGERLSGLARGRKAIVYVVTYHVSLLKEQVDALHDDVPAVKSTQVVQYGTPPIETSVLK
jgi:hypothetical protein